jgi:hypothetical protein
MAKFVATDFKTTINGVDFSTSLASVELTVDSDDVETTSFAGSGWRSRVGGLKNAALTLSWHQDFGAASVDATLWPLINTLATVVITPTSGSVTATNPSYTATALVNNYVVSGAVGDLATFDVTWPVSGAVTRATV